MPPLRAIGALLLVVLLVALLALALVLAARARARARARAPLRATGGGASKMEEQTREDLKRLTGMEFPSERHIVPYPPPAEASSVADWRAPDPYASVRRWWTPEVCKKAAAARAAGKPWYTDDVRGFELDGVCHPLRLAFEFDGPHHYSYDPLCTKGGAGGYAPYFARFDRGGSYVYGSAIKGGRIDGLTRQEGAILGKSLPVHERTWRERTLDRGRLKAETCRAAGYDFFTVPYTVGAGGTRELFLAAQLKEIAERRKGAGDPALAEFLTQKLGPFYSNARPLSAFDYPEVVERQWRVVELADGARLESREIARYVDPRASRPKQPGAGGVPKTGSG